MKRRYYPPTFEDFRDDVERSEDEMKTAHNLAQLIERHGPRGWIDALLADGGPGMMMQLEDAANCLERAQKYVCCSFTYGGLGGVSVNVEEGLVRSCPPNSCGRLWTCCSTALLTHTIHQLYVVAIPLPHHIHPHHPHHCPPLRNFRPALCPFQNRPLLCRSYLLRPIPHIKPLSAVQAARITTDVAVLGYSYQ